MSRAIIDHELIRSETYSRGDKCLIGSVVLAGTGLVVSEVVEAATGNIDMMAPTFGVGGLCLVASGVVVGLVHHFSDKRNN